MKLNLKSIALIVIGIAAIAFVFFLTFNSGFNPQEFLRTALSWINSLGYIGGAAFIGIYIIATVVFLPGSILTLGAGAIFGVILGSVYVFIGATLGAITAFLIGRYLLRDWVSQKVADNAKFKAIDQAVEQDGFKMVLLTRLSPVFPFNLLNYLYGVTGVKLKDYILGSVGMIPGTVMYVYIGSLAGSLTGGLAPSIPSTTPAIEWAVRVIGLGATVAVTFYASRIARQALAAQSE